MKSHSQEGGKAKSFNSAAPFTRKKERKRGMERRDERRPMGLSISVDKKQTKPKDSEQTGEKRRQATLKLGSQKPPRP